VDVPDSSQRRSSYSRMAIALHWTIALLVIGNVAGGLYMSNLFDSQQPELMAEGAEIAGFHKPVGLLILALTLWRLVLRLREDFIPLPGHMKGWEIVLARFTHVGFYVVLLVLPLTGWAFAVTSERPLSFFGLFDVPILPITDAARGVLHEVHENAGMLAAALIVLHVLGALKHHFLDRDDVLARMLPLVRRH
jgi:cytochrome b561